MTHRSTSPDPEGCVQGAFVIRVVFICSSTHVYTQKYVNKLAEGLFWLESYLRVMANEKTGSILARNHQRGYFGFL